MPYKHATSGAAKASSRAKCTEVLTWMRNPSNSFSVNGLHLVPLTISSTVTPLACSGFGVAGADMIDSSRWRCCWVLVVQWAG